MLLQDSEWKSAYMAALFENDKSRVPSRIASARSLLARRLCELTYAAEQRTERERIEHALKMLSLLAMTEVSPVRAVQDTDYLLRATEPGSNVSSSSSLA